MGVRLLVRSNGSDEEVVYEFDQDRILIGRGRGADVCLPHRTVSLRHATIELDGRRYGIVDHETTNGTRVLDARLVPRRPKPLRDHDSITIGVFSIVFRCDVPVTTPTSSERTSSLARRLARRALDGSDEDLRPSLVVLNGPQERERFVLPEPPARLVIGRGESCDMRLRDEDASREHAEIEVGVDGVRVRDLGSKNGISIGGRPVKERLLDDRDELRIGDTILLYEDAAAHAVHALEEGDDELAPPPPPPALAPPVEPAAAPPEVAEEEVKVPVPAPRPPRPSIAVADLVIYTLASVVFAASLLGLFWLLRS
jgi:pSer/pThr/pTyr-binding forkhead associated (FHA) protein